MHILISNDDGYDSPGIAVLRGQLSSIAKITVVAPTVNRSAASNSLTLDRPLRAHRVEDNVYAVDGTPTDCVHLAITGLLDSDPPDMVVSGINIGQNLGDDVIYSGTVAAATEGRFLGFPAIAVSLATLNNPRNLDCAGNITKTIIDKSIKQPLSSQIVLNVNIPDVPMQDISGMQATRLGSRHRAEPAIKGQDPQGRPIYWVGAAGAEQDAGPGTDFHAVNQNTVSITPLHVDLTHRDSIKKVADWLED